MARTPDKPGTYRIKPISTGGFRLSGVKKDGARVRDTFTSEWQAQSAADSLFGKTVFDDWGLPVSSMRASPETIAGIGASLGLPPSSPSTVPPVDAKRAEQQKKYAHSLMEMAGMGYAAGTVIVAKKVTNGLDKEPVNPSPKQVNDLADCAKETFTGWFGDRDIKPWQMMILLTFGIPLAMIMQSPPKKVVAAKEGEKAPDLKSVP